MKRVLLLAASMAMAGCTALGDDPFAYTKRELYSGGFDLAALAGANDTQQFRVTDGSIAELDARVWINATAGGGRVLFVDPSGRPALDVSGTAEQRLPLELGVWTVHVEGQPGSAGRIHILVTRA